MRKVYQSFLVLVIIIITLQSCSKDDLILQEHRLEMGRILLEVGSQNLVDVLPYYTEDVEYHDAIVDINGIQDLTAFLNQLILDLSPNLVTKVEDEILDGDTYTATWNMSGNFSLFPYRAKGISIIKFVPNSTQVFYQRDYYSEGDIMKSIPGLNFAVDGFRLFYKCRVDPTFNCPLPDTSSNTIEVEPPLPGQIENTQFAVGRELVEVNAENWTSIIPFLDNDYEYRDPIVKIVGQNTMATFLGNLFVGSSDLITIVEEETLADNIYMATWNMTGELDGSYFEAPGMSIVKFIPGTTQVYFSRDYYTEGDIMLGVPELADIASGFRLVYQCGVDPTFESDDCL